MMLQWQSPATIQATWLIARRAALESLHDRTTLYSSVFMVLLLPTAIVFSAIQPTAAQATTASKETALGAVMAVYLLVVGLGPSSGAISIASGVFAGEMEKGNLAPLLATPASNMAIFTGKVLGAVLPAFLYAITAQALYLLEIVLTSGPGKLRLLPLGLTLAMLVMVPAVAVLGATVASLISSRMRTYTAAQTLTGLVMFPIMGGLIALGFVMRSWSVGWAFALVAALLAADWLLILRSATSWRREEVMAQR